MKLFVETLLSPKPSAYRSSDGCVHVTLTGNGTFLQMSRQEAVELAAQLMRAANTQQEAA